MNTEQSYVGGGNNDQHPEQTVNKNEQTYPMIPAAVITSSPDLQETLAILAGSQMNGDLLNEALRGINIAYALGSQQAAAPAAADPKADFNGIVLRLLATRHKREEAGAVSEFELVHEALVSYRTKMDEHDPYEVGERLHIINYLLVDMADSLSELFNHRIG